MQFMRVEYSLMQMWICMFGVDGRFKRVRPVYAISRGTVLKKQCDSQFSIAQLITQRTIETASHCVLNKIPCVTQDVASAAPLTRPVLCLLLQFLINRLVQQI
jgi:hypothetical protein